MDKDRIAGSAKDFAGKVESTVGDLAGDAKTQAEGRAREAAGTVQNLYGRPRMPPATLRMSPSIMPRTPMITAATPFAAASRRWRKPCRTIRSAHCWSQVELALRWHC